MKVIAIGFCLGIIQAAILFSGCTSNPEILTASEIYSRFQDAYQNLSTYSYSISGIEDVHNTTAPMPAYPISISQTGSIDLINKNALTNFSGTPSSSYLNKDLYYLVNSTLYSGTLHINHTWTWRVTDEFQMDSYWYILSVLDAFLLLSHNATITRLPESTIQNTPCYVLNISIDISSINRNAVPYATGGNITEIHIIFYLDQESYLLLQVRQQTIMDLSYMNPGATMTDDLTITFSGYNEPLTIQPPVMR